MKRFNPIDARIQAKDSTQLSKPVYMNSGNFSKGAPPTRFTRHRLLRQHSSIMWRAAI